MRKATPTPCTWVTSLNLTLQLTFCPWLQPCIDSNLTKSKVKPPGFPDTHYQQGSVTCLAGRHPQRECGFSLCLLFSKRKGPLWDVFFWLSEAVMGYPSGLGTWKGSLEWWSHEEGHTLRTLLLWGWVASNQFWYLVRALGTGIFQPAEVRWEWCLSALESMGPVWQLLIV